MKHLFQPAKLVSANFAGTKKDNSTKNFNIIIP